MESKGLMSFCGGSGFILSVAPNALFKRGANEYRVSSRSYETTVENVYFFIVFDGMSILNNDSA